MKMTEKMIGVKEGYDYFIANDRIHFENQKKTIWEGNGREQYIAFKYLHFILS